MSGFLDTIAAKMDGNLRSAAIGQLARLGDYRSYTTLLKLARSDELDASVRIAALAAIGAIGRRSVVLPDSSLMDAIAGLTSGDSPVAWQAVQTLGLLPTLPEDAYRHFHKVYPQPQVR